MDIQKQYYDLVSLLEDGFLKDNEFAFLFKMDKKDELNFGFYNKKTNKIINYTFLEGKIINKEEDDAVDKDIILLPLSSLNTLNKLNDVIEEKLMHFKPMEVIYYLSNSKKDGLIWRITLVNQSLNVINLKVDVESMEIIEEDSGSMLA